MISGRYSLDREIGRGGMGAVWLGRDDVLDRAVAIKRVGNLLGGDSSPDLMRAEREARIAASLNHPNIVGIYDLVNDDEQQWLIMEYVEGATLADLIRDHGALPAVQIVPLLAQAASALSAAHASGIVHRDVKPSNIMVRADGQVRLTDFGIARALADAALTQTGLVTGSPAYLAPEVASGATATPASDVWSLGATLFHAIAGRPPYDVGDNVLGALYRIVNEPPPRLENAGPLAPVLLATMNHDPRQRWEMAEVTTFLEALVARDDLSSNPAPTDAPAEPDVAQETRSLLPPPVPPVSHAPRGRHRLGLPIAVGLVVVGLLATIGILLSLDDPQRSTDTTGLDVPSAAGEPSETGNSTSDAPASTPTIPELRSFIASYLDTASTSPSQGFAQLTPAFQRQSPRYRNFWGGVSDPQLLQFDANPETLVVDYVYRYEYRGRRVTDPVSLQLVQRGDRFLIAGEAR
ncbi:MAG: serine/threonine-protein kinase [Nocardioides sp.]